MIREGNLPEVCAQPAHFSQIPANAYRMRDLAEDNGWGTEVVYARGAGLGPRVLDLVVLRMQRDETWLAATYHDGRFHSAIQHRPLKKYNSRELKAVLEMAPGAMAAPWPPQVADVSSEILHWEYEMMDVYISGHPLEHVNMRAYPDVVDVIQITEEDSIFSVGEKVQILGIVEDPNIKKTRAKGTTMGFFGISDLTGMVNCLTFGVENGELLQGGLLVHAHGVVDERDEQRQVKVLKLKEITW